MIDFLGIGGQRCGTTWLYANLRSHPEVLFPSGKEMHYWDERYADGADPWLERFPPSTKRQGEITPSYAILPDDIVAAVARAAPELRLILNIRNPIQRSWSVALLFVDRCQMDPEEPTDAWFLDVFRSWRCRAKGLFSTTIDVWVEAFSEEQLALVVYDDIEERPTTVLRSVAAHIGVDPGVYPEDLRSARRRRGISTSRKRLPSTGLLEALRDMYGNEITRLESILGRDLGHWMTWDGS